MPRSTRYSPEVRERAVRMYFDHREHFSSDWSAMTSIASKLGLTTETLRKWVRRAEIDDGQRPGLTTDERARLKELEKENRELRRANEILKDAFDFLRDRARRSNKEVVRYIESRRDRWGVEPICSALQFAPATYYASRSRPPAARTLRDEGLKVEIARVYEANRRVYGADKVWAQLNREKVRVARCTVERLMAAAGLAGVRRGRRWKTTIADELLARPADLVDRHFSAPAPNRLWVADLTYVKTHSGFVYVAFVVDVFSRFVVGWQVSTSLRSDLALDALEMAIHSRQVASGDGLVHHSDRGVQFLSIRYTERLATAGIEGSVGSKGDSYDNALAESFNGLYKTELIYHDGPWKGLDDVEWATLSYVHWFNHQRLHSEIGMVPPAEIEAAFYDQKAPAMQAGSHTNEPL